MVGIGAVAVLALSIGQSGYAAEDGVGTADGSAELDSNLVGHVAAAMDHSFREPGVAPFVAADWDLSMDPATTGQSDGSDQPRPRGERGATADLSTALFASLTIDDSLMRIIDVSALTVLEAGPVDLPLLASHGESDFQAALNTRAPSDFSELLSSADAPARSDLQRLQVGGIPVQTALNR